MQDKNNKLVVTGAESDLLTCDTLLLHILASIQLFPPALPVSCHSLLAAVTSVRPVSLLEDGFWFWFFSCHPHTLTTSFVYLFVWVAWLTRVCLHPVLLLDCTPNCCHSPVSCPSTCHLLLIFYEQGGVGFNLSSHSLSTFNRFRSTFQTFFFSHFFFSI